MLNPTPSRYSGGKALCVPEKSLKAFAGGLRKLGYALPAGC